MKGKALMVVEVVYSGWWRTRYVVWQAKGSEHEGLSVEH